MNDVDVAVIGGGPGGSTLACYLRLYAPHLRVIILERETFPRDHVGESQLPPISRILDEMGCWDKVEAAGFPIKIGATYKWGKSKELWDFEFFPAALFRDEPRPAQYSGQRKWTAFQVDRAVYDKILLDHARELGAEVREQARVVKVHRVGDRVTSLELEDGNAVTAKHYVDASGHSGILRRAMGVETDQATSLQNIAIWDYWQNAKWAVSIGVGGTRVQVMSLGYGWIWFIPLGPTRTSVGLVVPAAYYKESGLRPDELYAKALAEEPNITAYMADASSENSLQTTKDWSFVSRRQVGENWFLVGEACGFADPILAAGLSLTHSSAREAALTIIELNRGVHDRQWLTAEYEKRQTSRIRSHVRFAEYWYTANSQFTELQAFTREIALESGLDLSPEKAWAWLAQGGFVDDDGNMGIAGFGTNHIKQLGEFLSDIGDEPVVKRCNTFQLHLDGAEFLARAVYGQGQITQGGTYVRGDRKMPMTGVFQTVVQMLGSATTLPGLLELIRAGVHQHGRDSQFVHEVVGRIPHAIEAMVADGWIEASFDPSVPMVDLPERLADVVHWNRDNRA